MGLFSRDKKDGEEAANRRKFSRVPVQKGSYYLVKDSADVHSCFIEDLSRGGVGMEIDESLAVGDKIVVLYEIDGTSQKDEARVVRVNNKKIGCQFTEHNTARENLPVT